MLHCYCIAWLSHVLPWKLCATYLPVAVPRLGGLEHYIFSRSAISLSCIGGTLLLAACGAQGLYWNLTVWSHPGGLVVFHWLRPSVDGPSWTQWGSMPVLVRDLAP